jgi:hypothetical protein
LVAYREFESAARETRLSLFEAFESCEREWVKHGDLPAALAAAREVFGHAEDLVVLSEAALQALRDELEGVDL